MTERPSSSSNADKEPNQSVTDAILDAMIDFGDQVLRDRDVTLARSARLYAQRDKARSQRDLVRNQRDLARNQRDSARNQRDRAREERDLLHDQFDASGVLLGGQEADGAAAADNGVAVEAALPTLLSALDRLSADFTGDDRDRGLKPDGRNAPFSYGNFFASERSRLSRESALRQNSEAGAALSVADQEILTERRMPIMHRRLLERRTPGTDIAFVTVANDRFLPGLVGLILSLLDVYPDLNSDIFVYHDGTLGPFAQRRLTDIYPHMMFVVPDMEWLDLEGAKSDSRDRIGKLGYMKFFALTHDAYRRVVVLDSDILLFDDISALWDGGDQDFRICYDCGAREYVAKSRYTRDWILNSGVISVPNRRLSAEAFAEAAKAVQASLEPCDDLIDRFADQKAWNMFLMGERVTHLELNYNCNIKYLGLHLGGSLDAISVIHFAGPKPWNDERYLAAELVASSHSKAVTFPKLWTDRYRSLLFKNRIAAFHRDTAFDRRSPVLIEAAGRTTASVLLTRGYHREELPDEVADLETFCFHWSDLVDEDRNLEIQHLVLSSHDFFGGPHAQAPEFPTECLEVLRGMDVKPVLWLPYAFKPLIDDLVLFEEFEVNYILLEAPFAGFVDEVGATECDLNGFLDDAREDVLTAGPAIAAALGFRTIFVFGLDSGVSARSEKVGDHASGGGTGPAPAKALEMARCSFDLIATALERKGVELRDASPSMRAKVAADGQSD